jgi:hypothetical protein
LDLSACPDLGVLNTHICATHIPGEENLIADDLSRNSQEWFVATGKHDGGV